MRNLVLTVLTPEKSLYMEQPVAEIVVTAFNGQMNLLPGHAPLIALLKAGPLWVRETPGAKFTKLQLGEGYCELSPAGVNILVDTITD